jgi:hypothetical protein
MPDQEPVTSRSTAERGGPGGSPRGPSTGVRVLGTGQRGGVEDDPDTCARALDTTGLRRAYSELDGIARGGGFGQPPPGEWDAEHMLAHVASTDAAAAAAALAIAAGQRPSYDNRISMDESNLQRIIRQAGGLAGLTGLVRRNGALLCWVAEQLGGEQLDVQLPVLIVSGDQVLVDEPRPLRALIEGLGRNHLPGHAQQLRTLRPSGQNGN